MDARSLEANQILYNAHRCKGCGRCLTVCPENAISADVVNIDEAVTDVLDRVRTRIDYT